MGDSDNFDASGAGSSPAERGTGGRQNPDPVMTTVEPGSSESPSRQPPSGDPSENGPPSNAVDEERPFVRRSSLRPAPPSFRPSTRDPALLRPAMVIHSGDTHKQGPDWNIADPAPSQPSQVPLERTAPLEPFALAEDLRSGPNATDPAMAIPPAATLPRELRAPLRHQTLGGFAAVVPPPPGPSGSRTTEEIAVAPGGASPTALPGESQPDPPFSDAAASETFADERSPGSWNESSPSSTEQHLPGVTEAADPAVDSSRKGVGGRGLLVAFATSAILVGVVVMTMVGRSRSRELEATSTLSHDVQQPTAAAIETAAIPIVPAEPANTAGLATPIPEPSRANQVEPLAPGTAEVSAQEPAASKPPPNGTTRVTLELKPIDAKVYYRGVAQPGPPYVFDLEKGQRIAVELTRFGFVTRKVTIDDKKPVIVVGMVRAPNSKRAPQ